MTTLSPAMLLEVCSCHTMKQLVAVRVGPHLFLVLLYWTVYLLLNEVRATSNGRLVFSVIPGHVLGSGAGGG